MAVAQKDTPPKQRGAAEVDAFKKKYAEAMEDAETSREHTDTEGWQRLYSVHRKAMEKTRKGIGATLSNCATKIDRGMLTEDVAKEIAEANKDYKTVCEIAKAFEVTVIGPVKEAMHRCHEVIEQARREARNLESSSPLISKGVLEVIEAAIKEAPKVTFDEEAGRILIAQE